MASSASHLEQARHNEALCSSIPETHPDWEITALFYAALHYLRAALAARGHRYTADDLRYDQLPVWMRLEGLEPLIDPFDRLRELSYVTRYKCRGSGWASRRLTDAERALKIIREGLQRFPLTLQLLRCAPKLPFPRAPLPFSIRSAHQKAEKNPSAFWETL